MLEDRLHRAVSADGTEIVGRVRGHGPAMVLVHGAIGDGDTAWEELLPYLTERFTCYLPSTRGRGRSGDSADHSPARLEEDVAAFVDSIGDVVDLVGWSGSGPWVLGAAAGSESVAAVAAFEPFVVSAMRADDLSRNRQFQTRQPLLGRRGCRSAQCRGAAGLPFQLLRFGPTDYQHGWRQYLIEAGGDGSAHW